MWNFQEVRLLDAVVFKNWQWAVKCVVMWCILSWILLSDCACVGLGWHYLQLCGCVTLSYVRGFMVMIPTQTVLFFKPAL